MPHNAKSCTFFRAYPELVWNDITYKALTRPVPLTWLSQRERGLFFVLTKSGYALALSRWERGRHYF